MNVNPISVKMEEHVRMELTTTRVHVLQDTVGIIVKQVSSWISKLVIIPFFWQVKVGAAI